MSAEVESNNKNENRSKTSQSQDASTRIKYKITPEEMWNCIKGSSQNWGIEGYEITKKYYDYRQVKWEQERKRILDAHKKEWPPQNWPKNKETDKLEPPKKKTFIDQYNEKQQEYLKKKEEDYAYI